MHNAGWGFSPGDRPNAGMNRIQAAKAAVSAVLLISALVGSIMLLTDHFLWSAAPSHAYGLIVFVVLDAGLAGAVWRMPRLALMGAALLGLVQFAAMAGDVFVGGPSSMSTALWQQYILGDVYFVALLGIQLVVVVSALVAFSFQRALKPVTAAA